MHILKLQLYKFLIVLFTLFLATKAFCLEQKDPADLIKSKEIGFVTQLGSMIPKNIEFINQNGNTVTFQNLLKPAKPTLFVPLYFGCPRLCGLLSDGFIELVNSMDLRLGSEYNIVTLSFDHNEDHTLANKVADSVYQKIVKNNANQENWHFITGNEESIKQFLDSVGYRFKFQSGEFLHSAGFFVLTPQGEVSQYFTGIQFSPWDVRLSLIEASKGAIGSAIDHIMLYCFDFDPVKGKYTWVAFNILRLGALIAVLLFVTIVVLLIKKFKLSR